MSVQLFGRRPELVGEASVLLRAARASKPRLGGLRGADSVRRLPAGPAPGSRGRAGVPEDVNSLLSTIETHVLETRDALGQISDLKWLFRMIQVAVATGLRRGALVALQWEDGNLENRSIHVRHRGDFRTKGNAERRVPVRGDAEEALVQMHEPGIAGPVFTNRDDEPVRAGRVTTRFKDMARKAGLDERVHFHSLRHTTGSWLAMQGVPMQQIQIILGHSDSKVIERYSHLAPETLDRAMEETFGE